MKTPYLLAVLASYFLFLLYMVHVVTSTGVDDSAKDVDWVPVDTLMYVLSKYNVVQALIGRPV